MPQLLQIVTLLQKKLAKNPLRNCMYILPLILFVFMRSNQIRQSELIVQFLLLLRKKNNPTSSQMCIVYPVYRKNLANIIDLCINFLPVL